MAAQLCRRTLEEDESPVRELRSIERAPRCQIPDTRSANDGHID
jgi:hypothetical protein